MKQRHMATILVALSLFIPVMRGNAQALNWSNPTRYDSGAQTSVSVNSSNVIVEVHKSPSFFSTALWYRIGRINGGGVTWGKSQPLFTTSLPSSLLSTWPTVALSNDNFVVVAFTAGRFRSLGQLYYQIGKIDPTGGVDQEIQWLNSWTYYDTGFHPSISINDSKTIVEVHEGDANTKMFYRLGRLRLQNGQWGIAWSTGSGGIPYDTGEDPHVSINNAGDVLEVHSGAKAGRCYYLRGKLNGNRVNFATPNQGTVFSEKGVQPSVALTNFGRALSAYNGGPITSAVGDLSGSNKAVVNWQDPVKIYFNGDYPSIATNEDNVISTWTDNGESLFYSVTRVP